MYHSDGIKIPFFKFTQLTLALARHYVVKLTLVCINEDEISILVYNP